MTKKILITGSTDGIGLEACKILAKDNHHLLLHGRNPGKLETVKNEIIKATGNQNIETYIADLSRLEDINSFVDQIKQDHEKLDILINNAGILKSPNPTTDDGFDIRFAVNTIAPYILAKQLLPLLGSNGRVINLSSAAQAPVNLDALKGTITGLGDMDAYSQSKLAITMWSYQMAQSSDTTIIAVNPGSLLASKMVKEGFGIEGKDISIGAEILVRLSLDDEFKSKLILTELTKGLDSEKLKEAKQKLIRT